MWPFRDSKKGPPRRANGRKNAVGEPQRRWERFRRAGGVGSVALAAGFFAAVLALDATPLEPLAYRRGGYVGRDVYARVTFHVPSREKTDRQRIAAARRTPAVIRYDEQALNAVIDPLRNLPGQCRATTQPAGLGRTLRKKFALDAPADLAAFAAFAHPDRADDYTRQIDDVAAKLLERFIVSEADYIRAYHRKDSPDVRVVGGASPGQWSKARLLSAGDDLDAYLTRDAVGGIDPTIRAKVAHYLKTAFVGGAAIWRLDEQATEAAEADARAAVVAVTEPVLKGALLVARTTRTGLSDADHALLAAEHRAFLDVRRAAGAGRRFALLAGRFGMIGAVVVLLGLYIYKYRPRIVANHWRGLAVAALLIVMLLLSKTTAGAGRLNPYVAVFGLFLASAILTIAYDQRFAFAVAGALVVLTALQLRAGLGELMVLWATAAATVFQLREVRTRSKLIATGGLTAAVVLAMVWAVEMAAGTPARFTLIDAGFAAAAALAGGFVMQGVLPLIERAFGLATSLTLLEWCDANKPLLKRLALEAPGTYNHSLLLGSMCEAAAEAIGAGPLVARVGAYYHDIGKINKPEYFVENQAGSASKHDRLSPAMSLLLIKGHVKDGLEMAKEYGLPRPLHEFIVGHHGTTVVEYFYHAARRRQTDTDRAPDEVEFRYPGPKPRSKEVAILMLADASESSVRAMSEPTAGRIETQVHTIISKRLMDGQLDECDLTLKEVHAVEGSLVKSLVGIYHGRVAYPSQDTPAEPPADAKAPKDAKQRTDAKVGEAAPPAPTSPQARADG